MKCSFFGLILFAFLFTLAISAPVERGGHHLSSHHRLSRRIQAALAKRPLNLTFTPIDSADVLVQAEYGASTQLQTLDPRFSATLLKLGRDDEVVDTERLFGHEVQAVVPPADTYGGRHVVVSMPDSVVQALQQRGVSQDNLPQYIRQNVHVTDPSTGNQYQLVLDSHPGEHVSIDSTTIVISEELVREMKRLADDL